jgi:ribosomal protein S18 acetylase RimI-like enzyme
MDQLHSLLAKNPVEHAWLIQDLAVWPNETKVFWKSDGEKLSYLAISGHPSSQRGAKLVLAYDEGELASLLPNLPAEPFVIRESRLSVVEVMRPALKNPVIYPEYRMDVDRASFRPYRNGAKIRQLQAADATAMASFFGAPPQAVGSFLGWIQGTVVLAAFAGDQIAAIGTFIVRTKEAYVLAAIETAKDQRGKGFASAVTSALTEQALEKVPFVSLTVLQNNEAALKVYSRLGFTKKEARVWMDCGAGSKP